MKALGVDEIAWGSGHTYLTLVYDIGAQTSDCWPWKRTGRNRACAAVWIAWKASLPSRFVCSDMWKPYLNVIASCWARRSTCWIGFMSCSMFSKAIDEIRRRRRRGWCVTVMSLS